MRAVVVMVLVAGTGLGCSRSQELGPRPDGGRDARRFDAGDPSGEAVATMPRADAGVDPVDSGTGRFDASKPKPPEELPPRRNVTFGAPTEIYAGAELPGGALLVGRSDRGPMPRRHASAYFLGQEGTSWGEVFDDGDNIQFFAAGSEGPVAVAAGYTRGHSVTDRSSNDLLLVQFGETGAERAASWGTLQNEVLFGITPGEGVAAWVGVGYHEPDGREETRDALVAAFDGNLRALWAVSLDAGSSEQLYSVVVAEDQIFAVGRTQTGAVNSGLIASLSGTGDVLWSYQFGNPDANDQLPLATFDPDSGYFIAAGSYNETVDEGVGVILPFDRAGGLTGGVSLASGRFARILNLRFVDDSALIYGSFRNPGSSFFARADRSSWAVSQIQVLEDMAVHNWRSTPILFGSGVPRAYPALGDSLVEVPVATDGRACGGRPVVPIVQPLEHIPSPLTLTRRALTLVGGTIADFSEGAAADPVQLEEEAACDQ